MKLAAVTIDCPDPDALAEFYARATGFERSPDSDPEYIELTGPNGVSLGFERVADYRPPQWPGQQTPQQCHLDFAVPDLDEGEARLLTLGATKAEVQPEPDRWRVLIDPAGHPFCLVIDGA
ncbi:MULTISPECIES: VOC family protein [Nocardia]|uniref:Catechol 2,3-dioxygenase-like lactoylglutathione lyase family enzyme n=2 Tax=Nocardia TaxID=1817 RepID=A0A4R6PS86_NOCIG|nr:MULTISPECIES: VOC family protein [Nocardia]TDP41053.1 catechol 2,3-dioxygenase-like lactoylglutathione lyase family enzyme [Nocardia ignorata]